jgi:PGF-CTERM protein
MRNEFVAVAVAVLVAATAASVGLSGSVTANHGAEFGNYTVVLPFESDHYPRGENPGGPYNGSINHFAAGTQTAWDDVGAPDGLEKLDYIIIENQDIDFTECTSDNTAAYGIDRDNDDPGTKTDVSLLNYMVESNFNPNSIVVEHYDGDELGAPDPEDEGGKEEGREDGDGNPEVYPDDEIVAHQGYKSAGGPCYGMPEEPGWYQIQGFANGTSWSGEYTEIHLPSHYFYICVCESRQEAVETLGPPPSESGDGDGGGETTETETETPTETATATATETATETEASGSGGTGSGGAGSDSGDDRGTATATDAGNQADQQDQQGGQDGGGNQQRDGSQQGEENQQQAGGGQQQQQQQQQQSEAVPVTPTIAEGPGFGPGAALLALAGAALLALRRRTD